MSHDFHEPSLGQDQIDELLDDIEIRCTADVAAARELSGLRRKVAFTIRPANADARDSQAISAESLEFKTQGTTSMTNRPVAVGSVFHLSFDREQLDLAPILAVCDRCAMLGDGSFEARFKFVHEVILPN